MQRFSFPRWSNYIAPVALGAVGLLVVGIVASFWYYGTNKHFEVGYQPIQPVPFSHKLHAGELGMDCRFCHYTVERSAFAAVPPTEVCMNCHSKVRTDSPRLIPVLESHATGKPIPWIRVHNLPDYVYFDHSAHLAAGVACQNCHGRVDQMIRVTQVAPLSMSWCLDCHRHPTPSISHPSQVTRMDDKTQTPLFASMLPPIRRTVTPPLHCSGCHR